MPSQSDISLRTATVHDCFLGSEYITLFFILLVSLWARSQIHVLVVQKALERYLLPDARQMVHELTEATGPGFRKLNDAVSLLPKSFRI